MKQRDEEDDKIEFMFTNHRCVVEPLESVDRSTIAVTAAIVNVILMATFVICLQFMDYAIKVDT